MLLNNVGPSYRITRVIKAGGQGAVFEAMGEDGKLYAVKQMLDSFGNDTKERTAAVQRFNAEARLLQRLRHPRIPRVYAIFNDEGYHYLSMDFVRGEDLEDRVEREGAQPEARVLEWAEQTLDVLDYLHGNGLIYRDMKPSNVMIDSQDGRVKLVDFGLAKVFQPSQQGTSIGTPGYAPPEQYQGLASLQSDIFSLGATLHHLLTGRDPTDHPPFNFPPARQLNPQVSQRVSDALERALQMRAEDRFPSLEAFRAALLPAPAGTQALPSPAWASGSTSGQPTPPSAQASQQPAPPQAVHAPPPSQAAQPVQQAARPAAPQPQAQPVPPPAQPIQQAARPAAAGPVAAPAPRQRSPLRSCLFSCLLLLALCGAGLAAAWVWAPELIGSLPGLQSGPTATPQTFLQQPFEVGAIEIIVPKATSLDGVRQAYGDVYLELARQRFGQGVQLEPGSFQIVEGPEWLGDSPEGSRYRASLSGSVLVPQG